MDLVIGIIIVVFFAGIGVILSSKSRAKEYVITYSNGVQRSYRAVGKDSEGVDLYCYCFPDGTRIHARLEEINWLSQLHVNYVNNMSNQDYERTGMTPEYLRIINREVQEVRGDRGLAISTDPYRAMAHNEKVRVIGQGEYNRSDQRNRSGRREVETYVDGIPVDLPTPSDVRVDDWARGR